MMNSSRRSFILSGLALLSTAGLLSKRIAAESPKVLPPDVDMKEAMAVTLGYNSDAKKVDIKKFPKRSGAEGAKQFCDNCQLYTADKDGKGKCVLFQNRLVAAKGWCSGWVKKA